MHSCLTTRGAKAMLLQNHRRWNRLSLRRHCTSMPACAHTDMLHMYIQHVIYHAGTSSARSVPCHGHRRHVGTISYLYLYVQCSAVCAYTARLRANMTPPDPPDGLCRPSALEMNLFILCPGHAALPSMCRPAYCLVPQSRLAKQAACPTGPLVRPTYRRCQHHKRHVHQKHGSNKRRLASTADAPVSSLIVQRLQFGRCALAAPTLDCKRPTMHRKTEKTRSRQMQNYMGPVRSRADSRLRGKYNETPRCSGRTCE